MQRKLFKKMYELCFSNEMWYSCLSSSSMFKKPVRLERLDSYFSLVSQCDWELFVTVLVFDTGTLPACRGLSRSSQNSSLNQNNVHVKTGQPQHRDTCRCFPVLFPLCAATDLPLHGACVQYVNTSFIQFILGFIIPRGAHEKPHFWLLIARNDCV